MEDRFRSKLKKIPEEYLKYIPDNDDYIVCNSEKKICMIWTPKCACSTAFRTYFDFIEFEYDKFKWIHPERMKKYRTDNYDPTYLSFQIVRNPFIRIISSYLHVLRIRPWVYEKKLSFYDFLKFLDKKNPNKLDSHTTFQFKIPVKNYLKLENIKTEVKNFNLKNNIELVLNTQKNFSYQTILVKKNKNKKIFDPYMFNHKLYDVLVTSTFFDNSNTETINIDYSEFYTKKIKNLVQKIYFKDINYFNYEFPYVLEEK